MSRANQSWRIAPALMLPVIFVLDGASMAWATIGMCRMHRGSYERPERMRSCATDLQRPLNDARLRKEAHAIFFVRLNLAVQIAALAERHHQAQLVGGPMHKRVVVADHVRMLELSQQLRLLEGRCAFTRAESLQLDASV